MTHIKSYLAGLLAGMLFLVANSAAQAQAVRTADSGVAHVSASGRVHLQRVPTHLRMYLQVSGRGKTLEEALAALKERREIVSAQLDKLGADKTSIVFTPPSTDDTAVAQQKRMEMMIVQRLGNRGAKKGTKTVKPPVSMVSMLTVQWPLSGDSPEKLLLAADDLCEKIKAADLGGSKEAVKLSPEEQEVAEEMAAEIARNSGSEQEVMKPNEPHFVFVSRLSAADRQQALADAFAKAKAQAAELAKAAEAELGSLISIDGGGVGGYRGAYSPYSNYQRNEEVVYYQQAAAMAGPAEDQRDESLAPKPDSASFDFAVNATFALR